MEKLGVISLGEAFVDYVSVDASNTTFQPFMGGATVNVAAGTSRLGLPTYYLCKLGHDDISHFVEQELIMEGIHTEFSVHSASKKICGVYVYLNEDGERFFHSYLNETPDEVLTVNELRKEVFEQTKAFYFGSGTLFHDKAKAASETSIQYARDAGNFIAFDSNIRLKRWTSEEQCRETITSFIKKADLVKIAEDELYFLTQTHTLESALELVSSWKIPFLFVTMGGKGAFAVMDGKKIFVPAPEVNAVDTTGAGDAFMSALIFCFHDYGKPANLSELTKYLQFANQVGAAATTKIGALTATIDVDELKKQFE
ncbi:carbohydrate kinase family protein [Bacillus sp. USDA818B3_A]|uniref:carbohydrate kinase family protein n=1 Tax=Bacillus sp. USDA818B3_A TaxID=2698834 RepID=UPI00136CC005|nr:carbohydrate kinase [Bacillus sp. USDA818B3_A]